MILSGTGITTPIEFKVTKWKPVTNLALQWVKTVSGNWVATDREADNDTYDCDLEVYGHEYYVNQVLKAIGDNREAGSNVLSLTKFSADGGDMLFGADIDYSGGLSVTVTKLGERKQKSWHGHGVSMRMRVLSPSFTGSATMPDLKYVERGYKGDSTWTITKPESQNGTFAYVDNAYDSGYWEGEVRLSTTNMRNFRRYIATTRGTAFNVGVLGGVLFPWGPRRTGTMPIPVKLIDFDDKGMDGLQYWIMELKIAEQVVEI